MAKIDGRVNIDSAGLLTFEAQGVTAEEDLLCAVCGEHMELGAKGAKAAAIFDTQRHHALCQLAVDPGNGEALRSHVMHTWCAKVACSLEACPGCLEEAPEKPQPKARITRMGFDVGGVIVRHREDMEEDTAGLTREDYLKVKAAPGALESLAVVVRLLGSDNVHIISKCGPETEKRTRDWMKHSGFFKNTGILRENVHFVRLVKEKAPKVAELGLDGFVDDRMDVLRPMLSLPKVRPLLFMPDQKVLGLSPDFWIPRVEKLSGWEAVLALLHPEPADVGSVGSDSPG